jgi:alkanesulfonate monooxygenase SsuD/methylene tetrahydromethanopterin reductase-like flavin-dependent oxidoreductase (luciferase family)
MRLRECVDVIARLLAGDEVSHDGLVTVDRARLWTLPDPVPVLVGPAVSVETAAAVAGWAGGLITVNQSHEHLRHMVEAYRSAGGIGPARLQVHLSWAHSEREAESIAHDQWRSNVFPPPASWDIDSAAVFDIASEHVTSEQVRRTVLVSSDLGRHAAWLHDLASLGFDELYLHHVGQEQAAFIDAFGDKVLPQLDQGR